MSTAHAPRAALAALALALAACAGDGADADSLAADTASSMTAAPAPAAAPAADGALLDPNAASRDELAAVPGMTPEAADAIVAGRPYQSMVGVDSALASLGEATRDSVYARVFVPIDLNTASDEEILLIPGVGDRMLHEFKEYRPYDGIERFRREIGKYVDSTEVARFERYVRVNPGQ
jgi:DNA uptake protein ComE-like DNA-binding protein